MKIKIRTLALLLVMLAELVIQVVAKENTIFRFNFTDGAYPLAGLIADSQGNLYGAAAGGGGGDCSNAGCGMVFELAPASGGTWTEKVLYVFEGTSDGGDPLTNLLIDGKGNLYGCVTDGGANNLGGLYKLTPAPGGTWTESLVFSFAEQTGFVPGSQIVADTHGNIFLTLQYLGPGLSGTVFELSPQSNGTWSGTVIYAFSGENGDGDQPYGGVILDHGGNVYGTTGYGGAYRSGTVYQLTPNGQGAWTENILYNFMDNQDGGFPESPLTIDGSGNLYGTTLGGGSNFRGVAFELSQSGGKWSESVLHDFGSGPSDGFLANGMTFGANGVLYGTTLGGGDGCNGTGCGIVFQLTPQGGGQWQETILHQFESILDGSQSQAPVLIDNKGGRLFGVTQYGGGMYGYGTVFMTQP